MVMLAVLGKKLRELVGRARFCLLHFAGSIGGVCATFADPASNADSIECSVKRYANIVNGAPPGQYSCLGASDAVMAILAAFYVTFPRTPVPNSYTEPEGQCVVAVATVLP